jgi:hypothetical protein
MLFVGSIPDKLMTMSEMAIQIPFVYYINKAWAGTYLFQTYTAVGYLALKKIVALRFGSNFLS